MYLIIEKENDSFNLYWANRPSVNKKVNLNEEQTLQKIRLMLDKRFPFMDIQKLMSYQVESNLPPFSNSSTFITLDSQENKTNCVLSNLFGMVEALDKIKDIDKSITDLRYETVRKVLIENYEFNKNDFFPNVELGPTWTEMVKNTFA